MSIVGNMAGCYSPIGKTFIIEDADGNSMTGVITEQQTLFTANASDIKIGKIAATEEGITEGTDTKMYRTIHSDRLILPGENFSIELSPYDQYDYTKFQCIISKFNTSFSDSIYTDKISLNNGVYNVSSLDKLSDITKNTISKSIDLNIVNNTEDSYVIHFNSYREEGA